MSTRSGRDRFFMMGDNSPREQGQPGLGDRTGYPPGSVDRPQALGGPTSAPDRQGVLRLLAARESVRARYPAVNRDFRIPFRPYFERMKWIR